MVINKHKLDEFSQKIANLDKKAIIKYIQSEFIRSWSSLQTKMAPSEKVF